MIPLALFSDQPVLLQGFGHVLSEQGFEVLYMAAPDGSGDLRETAPQGGAEPQIALLDITAGLTFGSLGAVHSRYPNCPILLWADSMPLDLVFKTLDFGVRGIVLRTSAPAELIDSLRKVARGEMPIGFAGSREVAQTKRAAALTPREREIVALLRQGMRNKQIAAAMGITEGTVKIYLFRLFHKLGVRNRFDLARCSSVDQLMFHLPSNDAAPRVA